MGFFEIGSGELFTQGWLQIETLLLYVGVEVLQAGIEGPCLHRPGNWLVRQLNDKPKPVYRIGSIREKGKATARSAWGLETSNLMLR
jgi:hypothetical protein